MPCEESCSGTHRLRRMNNVNHVAPAVTYELPRDVARTFEKAPLVMRVVSLSYFALWLGGFMYLVIVDTENFQKYKFFGIAAFALSFALNAILKRLFLGRAVAEVSQGVTARLGQSEAFRAALSDTLMATPWSKYRLTRGRYKKAQFDNLYVLLKDGSYTYMSIAPDCSRISIVPPAKTV